jgi:hypothetical protein
LKWLLNERAAIAGDIEKAAARYQYFAEKVARQQKQLETLTRKAQDELAARSRNQATLDALDVTIGLVCQKVWSDAGGVIRAWAGRYGERGALTKAVGHALEAATPSTLSTRQLLDFVVSTFGIVLVNPADRRSLNHSVKSALSALVKAGKVENFQRSADNCAPGIWRWNPQTSFAGLAAKAERIARMAAEVRNAQCERPTVTAGSNDAGADSS